MVVSENYSKRCTTLKLYVHIYYMKLATVVGMIMCPILKQNLDLKTCKNLETS